MCVEWGRVLEAAAHKKIDNCDKNAVAPATEADRYFEYHLPRDVSPVW
jgi:hypothetical protein